MTVTRVDDVASITGIGVVSPIGIGCEAFSVALRAGRHGIRPVRRFSTDGYDVHIAATYEDAAWDRAYARLAEDGAEDPVSETAWLAADEAAKQARLSQLDPSRIAVILGTTAGALGFRSAAEFVDGLDSKHRVRLLERSMLHTATTAVADRLGARGPRITLSTACTSSTHAIGHAIDLLATGQVDAVVAGGVDYLVEEIFAGFYAMGAMSASPCAPFSEPIGMTVGEGAGFMVLEGRQHAKRRGAHVRAEVLGYGLSLDAFHALSPEPTGAGIARAVTAALTHARLDAHDVGYVNAHGTGTAANDEAEWSALRRVFGDRAHALPVSSTKSYLGHAMGAAGVLELAACVLCLAEGSIPPTLNFTRPRGSVPDDVVATSAPRSHPYQVGVSTNSAFGGANAALVFASPGTATASSLPARRSRVVILGAAVLAAHGIVGFGEALRRGEPLASKVEVRGGSLRIARVPRVAWSDWVRGVDPRWIDAAGRSLTLAAAAALRDAGIRITGNLRERTGLFVATTTPAADTAREFWRSIRERGYPRLSAAAFARTVVNSCAGAASCALTLRGPVSVVSSGQGGTLTALGLATEMLSRPGDVDAIVVGAVDDVSLDVLSLFHDGHEATTDDARCVDPGEGSAGFVLARHGTALGLPLAEVAGWSTSAPDRLRDAIDAALGSAESGPEEVEAVYAALRGPRAREVEQRALREVFGARLDAIPRCDPSSVFGVCEVSDAFALAAGIERFRPPSADAGCSSGTARPPRLVLITCTNDDAGSAAVVLRRVESRMGG